jgi:hypothetical protein
MVVVLVGGVMRLSFANAKLCEDAWQEALSDLRETLRGRIIAGERKNPFARPLPCPLGDLRRTGTVLRVF